jgi:hypothetical protein
MFVVVRERGDLTERFAALEALEGLVAPFFISAFRRAGVVDDRKWARNVPPGAETSRQLQKFTRGMGSYSREEILDVLN